MQSTANGRRDAQVRNKIWWSRQSRTAMGYTQDRPVAIARLGESTKKGGISVKDGKRSVQTKLEEKQAAREYRTKVRHILPYLDE